MNGKLRVARNELKQMRRCVAAYVAQRVTYCLLPAVCRFQHTTHCLPLTTCGSPLNSQLTYNLHAPRFAKCRFRLANESNSACHVSNPWSQAACGEKRMPNAGMPTSQAEPRSQSIICGNPWSQAACGEERMPNAGCQPSNILDSVTLVSILAHLPGSSAWCIGPSPQIRLKEGAEAAQGK